MVRRAAGYCSDALHMAVVTCIVQGKPGVAVADRGVGICTGELRKGGGGGKVEGRWRGGGGEGREGGGEVEGR